MSFKPNDNSENPITFATIILIIIVVFVLVVFGACLYTQ